MPRGNRCALLFAFLSLAAILSIGSGQAAAEDLPPKINWVQDYATAVHTAQKEGKMVFIYFEDADVAHKPFAEKVLVDSRVAKLLSDFVCVKMPLTATAQVAGKTEVLLKYASFRDLEGKSGVAILDFTHKGSAYYGYVVSVYSFPNGGVFSVRQTEIMLTLPPGARRERNIAYTARARDCRPLATTGSAAAEKSQPATSDVPWFTSYAKGVKEAQAKRKMMVVLFTNTEPQSRKLETETMADPKVCAKLRDFVCVRIPVDTKILSDGKELTLLQQRAFQEMLGRPGVAILDFADMECAYGGCVVSTFPLTNKLWYDAQRMCVILGLPAGTLTQRTLVYAVRIHPDQPKSTSGQLDKTLEHEAESHSQYQASIGVQGHHFWNTRFQRINALLPFGLIANEVCAESWPGDSLVEAAIECVRCWRLSSGHWSSVVAPHRLFGYDMKRGRNGIWYATGIFGKNR